MASCFKGSPESGKSRRKIALEVEDTRIQVSAKSSVFSVLLVSLGVDSKTFACLPLLSLQSSCQLHSLRVLSSSAIPFSYFLLSHLLFLNFVYVSHLLLPLHFEIPISPQDLAKRGQSTTFACLPRHFLPRTKSIRHRSIIAILLPFLLLPFPIAKHPQWLRIRVGQSWMQVLSSAETECRW